MDHQHHHEHHHSEAKTKQSEQKQQLKDGLTEKTVHAHEAAEEKHPAVPGFFSAYHPCAGAVRNDTDVPGLFMDVSRKSLCVIRFIISHLLLWRMALPGRVKR